MVQLQKDTMFNRGIETSLYEMLFRVPYKSAPISITPKAIWRTLETEEDLNSLVTLEEEGDKEEDEKKGREPEEMKSS